MSDNIPYDIQLEIIKKVPDVKSLIRFSSVSKQWKSFIDTSEFITSYGVRPTNRLLLRYKDTQNHQYLSFIDDTNFTQHVPLLIQQLDSSKVIGSSHGLLCVYGLYKSRKDFKEVVVLWNPCIRKCISIPLPYFPFGQDLRGFAVCPVTSDPTIVKFSSRWQAQIYTLSSKRWMMIPCSNSPRSSVKVMSSQVATGSCIYWVAREILPSMDVYHRYKYMIISFDFIAKGFRVIDIPNNFIKNQLVVRFFISTLRESLVMFLYEILMCVAWKMEHDGSFSKLFTFKTPDSCICNILGFRKNGELVMETRKTVFEPFARLEVYDPCSKRTNNLGIYGEKGSFFMDSYKETLLLLKHKDGCVYPDFN